MKLAVMQPYFFPYLGYFQLIAAVDKFIVWDDVQYIQRGWVNRNRILLNGEPTYITLPLEKAHLTANINERVLADMATASNKMLGQLHAAYRKAPHYQETRALFEKVLALPARNLGKFLFQSLRCVCAYLDIKTELVLSSAIRKESEIVGGGSSRILAMCQEQQATMYVNAIGGRELYRQEEFAAQGMDLRFIAMDNIEYSQGGAAAFVPYLSIIDVLMYNGREATQAMLQQYSLQP
ncbi:MAG: WbqC family protein [Cellvibrionales bacterium]|nr:WbqC family protein [Cellvibrionales bacterium]